MDDTLLLARAQFGLNIGFHILFPALTIGLGWMLVYFRARHLATGQGEWLATFRLWAKIFGLSFAMGVVSGLTMSFQFGTNWPGYMNTVGNIAGPLLSYEVLFAFFMEATFLGVVLFGLRRVSPAMHLFATVMVAIGTTMSAFWILALNSWMQTPAGHVVQDGALIAGDWWSVIFNPSFPYRLAHMTMASGLTASFFLAGLSAWRLLRAPSDGSARVTLRTGLIVAAVLAPIQIAVGDLHGLNTLEHQPAKVAAMEALWETRTAAPLVLFALPNATDKRNDWAIEVPGAASLILRHDRGAEVKGLNQFAPDIPPVWPVFFAFRTMVGIGLLMLASSWLGVFLLRRNANAPRWLLWGLSAMTFSGWIATVSGWLVTEIGRQPWLVTGLLRTVDAVGEVPGAEIHLSFAAYATCYCAMLIAYMVVVTHLARDGASAEHPA